MHVARDAGSRTGSNQTAGKNASAETNCETGDDSVPRGKPRKTALSGRSAFHSTRVHTDRNLSTLHLDVESISMRRTTLVMAVFLRAIVFLPGLSVSLIVSKNQRANFARFTSFTGVDDVVAEGESKEPSRSGAIAE